MHLEKPTIAQIEDAINEGRSIDLKPNGNAEVSPNPNRLQSPGGVYQVLPGGISREEMIAMRKQCGMEPATFNYQDPDSGMRVDVMWNAIWNEIKTWDINVPTEYGGYSGATGNHVTAIYLAIRAALESKETANAD